MILVGRPHREVAFELSFKGYKLSTARRKGVEAMDIYSRLKEIGEPRSRGPE